MDFIVTLVVLFCSWSMRLLAAHEQTRTFRDIHCLSYLFSFEESCVPIDLFLAQMDSRTAAPTGTVIQAVGCVISLLAPRLLTAIEVLASVTTVTHTVTLFVVTVLMQEKSVA